MTHHLRQCACTLAFMQCIQGNAPCRESYGKWCSGGVPKRPFICEAPITFSDKCKYPSKSCVIPSLSHTV